MNHYLLNYLKNRDKKFLITFWDGQASLTKLDDLYNLCIASIIRDYNFNEKIKLRDGDFVELSLTIDGKVKIGRYIYRGIHTDGSQFPQVKLEVDDDLKTWFHINADNILWRLKKIKTIGRLNNNIRLRGRELNQLNFHNHKFKELTNRAFTRLVADSGIEQKEIYSFKRTKVLFLLKGSFDGLQTDNSNNNGLQSFNEVFPVGIYSNCQIRDWNPIGHLMTQRGYDNNILFFSLVEDVLEFIEKHHGDKFLIITDKFKQIYKNELYQQFIIFFENNGERVSLLVLPHTKHLKNIFGTSTIPINNPLIIPILYPAAVSKESEIMAQVHLLNDDDIEKHYRIIDQKIIYYRQNYMPFADIFQSIKWLFFTLSKEQSLAHISFLEQKEKFIDEKDNLNIVQEIESVLLGKKLKFIASKEFLESNENAMIYVNSLTESDFEDEKYKNRKLNKSQFLAKSLSGKVLILYFIDYRFIRDQLFPELLFGNINLEQLKFVLYTSEAKILRNIYRNIIVKLKPLINNSRIIHNAIEIQEEIFEPEPIDLTELPDYDVDLNPNVYKHYIKNSDGKENDPPVDIKTYFFKDNLGNRYFACLTANFKPFILKKDELLKKDLDKIKPGSTFLFFGNEGARDILQNYSVLYYNNIDEEKMFNVRLELKEKWRICLKTYYDEHNFNSLKEKLIEQNLDLNDNKLERWLNDENLIGPQDSEEVIKKIGQALDDEYLKSHHNEIAEAIKYFQSKAKLIGKNIRKIALKEFTDITHEDFYQGLSEDGKQKILEIAESINLVDLSQIDDTTKKVLRSESNKLFILN